MATPIKTMAALIHVQACRALSASGLAWSLPLVHLPGNAAETTNSLWMVPMASEETYVQGNAGMMISSNMLKFEFAIQSGFTGDEGAVSIGDSIGPYDGRMYQVQSIANDQTGAIFTVTTTVKTARTR